MVCVQAEQEPDTDVAIMDYSSTHTKAITPWMRYEDRNSLPNLKAKLDVLSPDTYDILLTKWHMEAEAYIGLAWRGSEERPDPRIDLWALSAVANDQPAADNESVGRLLFKHERQAFRNTISRIAAQNLPHFHGYERNFVRDT